MDSKHPHGELLQVIGDVDRLEHFYEYQLYYKNLTYSIQKFTKYTLQMLKLQTFDKYISEIKIKYNIEDRINTSSCI